jgi:hypothetical protein
MTNRCDNQALAVRLRHRDSFSRKFFRRPDDSKTIAIVSVRRVRGKERLNVNCTARAALALLLVSLTGMTSCTGEAPPVPKDALALEVLNHYPGLREPQALLITDAAQWQIIWEQINVGRSEIPSLPSVDFQRHSLIVVSLGWRSTGGYNAAMELGSVGASKPHVIVTELAPGDRCVLTLEETYPTFTALTPSPLHEVSFESRRVNKSCG